MTIVLILSYDLPHEPVPKLMSSRDIVPIRDKLATGSRYQTLYECSRTIRDKVQSFCAQYRRYGDTGANYYSESGLFAAISFIYTKIQV